MGWWSSSPRAPHVDPAGEAHMQDAQDVIASIFEPGNHSLTSSTSEFAPREVVPNGTHNGRTPSESPSGGWRGWTRRTNAWLPFSPSAPPDNSEEAEIVSPCSSTATTSASGTTSPPLSWDQLPPSPLAGYELTKRGLVDRLRTPPHTLTPAELRDVIRELTKVEQQAKYDVDSSFSGHLGSRGLHGLELLVNPCLFLTGIYLMTWKTAQLYNGALPQESLVFTKVMSLRRWRMTADQREQLAQRHRLLMRATNARLVLAFLAGLGVFSLAWVSRPSRNVIEEAPDVQVAKETIAYQRHAEASLKWCWYVYYHHPAYRGARKE
ncbi:hypothetical protein ABB37_05762 [Leptomonas pyrrhocoris]|uniref:Transmembrane protein n=1 Tax=Leptomonas pyrrhocoris TaxID=157538 RepID=A0A0N0DUS7_LEPPY|nr:hypothetical protein ABB37_05762 [Leptomonas pyrrhocoris]KPA79298.1 hypothetical protein ABB37_05762 [Leptomonas pyrrhocoris]|eukprot:XP_015657737.1 hypothetical protein ABB37_05762 [Leptomonas pyrrhocoris]